MGGSGGQKKELTEKEEEGGKISSESVASKGCFCGGAASRGGALDSAGGCERKTAKGFPLALTFPCGEGCEVRRWPEAMGYPPTPPSQAKGGI